MIYVRTGKKFLSISTGLVVEEIDRIKENGRKSLPVYEVIQRASLLPDAHVNKYILGDTFGITKLNPYSHYGWQEITNC